jgi:hypothetical protein
MLCTANIHPVNRTIFPDPFRVRSRQVGHDDIPPENRKNDTYPEIGHLDKG